MPTEKPVSSASINQGSIVTGVQKLGGSSISTSEIPVQFTSNQYTTKFDDYGLRRKTIEIGDWNMNTTASITVAHGLTNDLWKNVKNIEIVIRNDADTIYYNDSHQNDIGTNPFGVEINKIDNTNVTLNRNGTTFDSTLFDTDSNYNRGWVTIWYE
tara:strand:- start:913 stop:1380 length:468 start_codon:yes stop_codon:yes gene_type:complete